MAVAITTESDPTPLVRLLAGTLRRAATTSVAGRLGRMKGVAVVRSLEDAQATTIRFAKGGIHLTHGVSHDAQVSIAMDLENDGLPGAPKPQVKGALAHIRFALALAKVLDPPLPAWQRLASEFWVAVADKPFMPSGLLIVDTDSGDKHRVGDDSVAPFEIHGPADRLAKVFSGSSFLADEAQQGRVSVQGSLGELVAITSTGLELALGLETPHS